MKDSQHHSNETWNFLRERLGLCPIEEVVRGERQNKSKVPQAERKDHFPKLRKELGIDD